MLFRSAVFFFLALAAFSQSLNTYLGTSGANPALTGGTVVVQYRASNSTGAPGVQNGWVWIKSDPSLSPEFTINIDSVGNTINMSDGRTNTNGPWPWLAISAGDHILQSPWGFADLAITRYNLSLAGNEYRLDLTLQRSAAYSGTKHITLGAYNGIIYSQPWGWTSAGTWAFSGTPTLTTSLVNTSLIGSSALLQIRVDNSTGAAGVRDVMVYLKNDAAASPDFSITVNASNNTLSMFDNRTNSNGPWPHLSLTAGDHVVSPSWGFADLGITRYNLALSGNVYQLDLTLQRSASYTGTKHITLGAYNGTIYSQPWVWTSAGTWAYSSATIGISSVTPIPIGPFSGIVTGFGFTPTTAVTLGGQATKVEYISANQLKIWSTGMPAWDGTLKNVIATAGSDVSAPFAKLVGTANAQVSWADASRFLEQAAFGPTQADVVRVQTLGKAAWLQEQFNTAPILPIYTAPNSQNARTFFGRAVNGTDQLRLRMAFALSQFFVVGEDKVGSGRQAVYQELLYKDAFGPYFGADRRSGLLYDVTLSAGMGYYLDMNGNSVNATVTAPNENYARELLQLFSIGTLMLTPDGSATATPTYSQDTIPQFARALTGWAIPGPTYTETMLPNESGHEKSAKTLLTYTGAQFTNLPANQTAQLDLEQSLANVAGHPNVGPFLGKFLIQHLVTSNPSPGYVTAATNAFNNPGGVRGSMEGVLTAILTNPEATTGGDSGNTLLNMNFGHLREPLLWMPSVLRAVNATVNPNIADGNTLYWLPLTFNQQVFTPPSVFNFYSPSYKIPGFAGLGGPEFQIHSPSTAYSRTELMKGLAELPASGTGGAGLWGVGSRSGNVITIGAITIDLSPYVNQPNTDLLIEAFNSTMTRGQMPDALKNTLKTALNSFSSTDPMLRAELALYLISTSTYFQVMH